jgi:hypothetical protein
MLVLQVDSLLVYGNRGDRRVSFDAKITISTDNTDLPLTMDAWMYSSTGPATIQSAQQAQFELPMQGIPVGNYGLVICVSFNGINIDDIEQWILDIRPSSDEGILYSLVWPFCFFQAFLVNIILALYIV